MLTWCEPRKGNRSLTDTEKPESGMTDSGSHLADLPVSPLGELDLKPSRWDVFPKSDGNRPRRYLRFLVQEPHVSFLRSLSFDEDPGAEVSERFIVRNVLNLNDVCAGVPELWLEQPVLQLVVVREDEESFTLGIKSSDGVDT